MEEKRERVAVMMKVLLFFVVFAATFHCCLSAANQPAVTNKKSTNSMLSNRFGSSAIFPVHGNVYPLGYYFVTIRIGKPPKPYDFDIDTGSDLTWVQCDAPCRGCTKPRDGLYKPNKNLVHCENPLCGAIHGPNFPCSAPTDQCDYEVEYADLGSSLGVLVEDYFPLQFTNGSLLGPRLAFGCGYDQTFNSYHSPPSTAGVLGLGSGKASILSQLHGQGLIRNMVGHCLSGQGGYLFFGDDVVPSSGIVWTPMSSNSAGKHYASGPAELYFGGRSTGIKGLEVVFDSGSSYTYLNSIAYQAIVKQLREDSMGKPLKEAAEDQSLPICWKGVKPFKSIRDVNNLFKPIALSFTNARKVRLQLPPEAYLIVTKHGNACLGILNGTEVGLGNLNVVGDISLQDKMLIYDNEKQQIGWIAANCDRLPNVDRDYNQRFLPPCAANWGILEDQCTAS